MIVASTFSSEVASALSLQELAYNWQHDPPPLDQAESLQYLVTCALKQCELLQLMWTLSARDGDVWEAEWYMQRLRVLEFFASVIVDILSRTQRIVNRFHQVYPDWAPPAAAGGLATSYRTAEDVLAKIKDTLARLVQPQPPINMDMLKRSRERPNRGLGEPIGETITRLESGGPLVME
jgi:hypothetical protein